MKSRRRKSTRSGRVALIGVPMDLGASLRGVDMGPSAIRIAGATDRLKELGCRVRDLGNLSVPHANVAGTGARNLKFVGPIHKACKQLAATVEGTLASGVTPLVLGGDHSIAIGTLAGLARHGARSGKAYGLLWVDAHGDCNTPRTTPTGNIHGMPLAVALGDGDARLTGLAPLPMIDPAHTVLFGVRILDPGERQNLRRLGCRVVTMREIDEHGVYDTLRDALDIVTRASGGFHLSFDMDGLDPAIAPGVGTPESGGLTVREGHLIMELVADTRRMVSCEIVEVNPVLDRANETAKLASELIYSAFGGSIF